MIELEKLSFDGEVLFKQSYPKNMANQILTVYGTYPESDKVRWRLAEDTPKRGRKAKENEND